MDDLARSIDQLPNDREVILGAAERLASKAHAAGVREAELTERMRGQFTDAVQNREEASSSRR
jgi:hypothetical protein